MQYFFSVHEAVFSMTDILAMMADDQFFLVLI